ncbi:unnamed protein product, partial [Timema podura]|nr:unnamed protein product [Timema podura]
MFESPVTNGSICTILLLEFASREQVHVTNLIVPVAEKAAFSAPSLEQYICEHKKLHLQGTDYGSFLANEPSPLQVSVIDDKLREKLVIEFQHMRHQAVEPLSTFLDYI